MFDALRVAGAACEHARPRLRDVRTNAADATPRSPGAERGGGYGRRAAVATSEDVVGAYRRRMPLATYADVEPYVKRIEAGEENVLNAAGETMLARTSGTSGRVALLPTTAAMSSTFFVRGILVVFDVLARRGCLDHLQHSCKLAFRATPRFTENGLRVGPNSSGPQDRSFEKLRRVLLLTGGSGFYEISAMRPRSRTRSSPRRTRTWDRGELRHAAGAALGLIAAGNGGGRAGIDDDIRTMIGDGLADELEEALQGPDEKSRELPRAADEVPALR